MDFLTKVDTIGSDAPYGGKWGHSVQKAKKS